MGLISVGIKVTFLPAQKKFSKAGSLIYCPDPKLEHFCLVLAVKNKSAKCEVSTLCFILLMDVLTAKRFLTMLSSCFFFSCFFSITYFYRTLGVGERTELPISWWHCVSQRDVFWLNPK